MGVIMWSAWSLDMSFMIGAIFCVNFLSRAKDRAGSNYSKSN